MCAAYIESLSLTNVAGPLVAEVNEETRPATSNDKSSRLGLGDNCTRTCVCVVLWPCTGKPNTVSFTGAYSGSRGGINRLSNSPLTASRRFALR